jgi:hypothetical protein
MTCQEVQDQLLGFAKSHTRVQDIPFTTRTVIRQHVSNCKECLNGILQAASILMPYTNPDNVVKGVIQALLDDEKLGTEDN